MNGGGDQPFPPKAQSRYDLPLRPVSGDQRNAVTALAFRDRSNVSTRASRQLMAGKPRFGAYFRCLTAFPRLLTVGRFKHVLCSLRAVEIADAAQAHGAGL